MQSNGLRIGISMRVVHAETYSETRDALSQDWAGFIKTVLPSAAWLAIPNLGAPQVRTYCEKWGINRLILTGGEDIGISEIRDETEFDLLRWANDKGVPVLGICRGMQLIGIWAGETLKPVSDHVSTRHILHGEISGTVNSFHNFSLSGCPAGFNVLARSDDGAIEAICHEDMLLEGWMWHPEREATIRAVDIERLRNLFA